MVISLRTIAKTSKEEKYIETQISHIDSRTVINDEGEEEYISSYYYIVDGVEYRCGNTIRSKYYPENAKVIYYNAADPHSCQSFKPYSDKEGFGMTFSIIIASIVPLGFIYLCSSQILKTNKVINKLKLLNQRGKLIKNYPCKIVDTNIYVNDVRKQKIIINYYGGLTLESEPKLLEGHANIDKADLLIDESNPDIYYIDLNINRISGNTDSDYYKG